MEKYLHGILLSAVQNGRDQAATGGKEIVISIR